MAAAQQPEHKEAAYRVLNEALAPLHRLAEFADAARVGQLLVYILRTARTIFIFHDVETDDLDGQKADTFRLSALWQDTEQTQTVTRDTLMEALETLCGAEKKKLCQRCNDGAGAWKVMSEFSRDATRHDGRHPYCKTCERKRIKEYKANRRR